MQIFHKLIGTLFTVLILTGFFSVSVNASDKDWIEKGISCLKSLGDGAKENIRKNARSTLRPDVLPDAIEAPYIKARLYNVTDKDKLQACIQIGDELPRPIDIRSAEDVAGREGVVDVVLPLDHGTWFGWLPYRYAKLMIASSDGDYVEHGSFVFHFRIWGLIFASLITALLVGGLLKVRRLAHKELPNVPLKKWSMGLFIGQDGQASLSLFQIFIWTILTVWAILFVVFNTGNLLTMTSQVMALLGFAGLGSLTARWVAIGRGKKAAGEGDVVSEPRFWAMLETDGKIDLFKVQLLLFTVLIAAYVAFRVFRQSAFPELDTEFLLLMGVSNGLYVGTKFTQSSPLAIAEAKRIERDVLRLRKDDLKGEEQALRDEMMGLDAKLSELSSANDPVKEKELQNEKLIAEEKLKKIQTDLALVEKDIDASEVAYKDAIQAIQNG